MPYSSDHNTILRKRLCTQRRALMPYSIKIAGIALAKALNAYPRFQNSSHIAFYYSLNGELDTSASLQSAQAQQKITYLPCLHPFQPRTLGFLPYTQGTVLKNNRYGIPEPCYPLENPGFITLHTLDLVIVPLVAYDRHHQRMGMGGGFYDTSFQNPQNRPYLLGVGYDFQRVDALSTQPWDIPMNDIISISSSYHPSS